MKMLPALAAALLLFASCNSGDRPATENGADGGKTADAGTPRISFVKAGAFPHDTAAFTEGLSFYKGQLWESTGNKGRSFLFQYDMTKGQRGKSFTVAPEYFGEGHVIIRDTAYMLTWQEHKAFFIDVNTMKLLKTIDYNVDGWGMTTDGNVIIASDGTSNLYFYEPGTMRLLRTQGITEGGMPVSNINELEYVNGFIYANVWTTNDIVKIDPNSGQIVGRLDLSELAARAKQLNPNADVLNGIAYNPDTKKFYVTGKNWPEIYEIQFAL